MPLNLPCRYSVEHGVFTNGISLRKHYDREHPEYIAPQPGTKSPERGTCSCGAPLMQSSFHKHWQIIHGGDSRYSWAPLRANRVVKAPVTHPEPERLSEEHTAPDPEVSIKVDDIVIVAIRALAHPSGVVPVAHLAALFAWREATATMLRAVGRS